MQTAIVIKGEVIMDYDDFLELAKKRRSIRRFKPDPIPDDYVDKIIEAARWAPSGYNSQPWEFIVVKDKKLKDSIIQCIGMYREMNSQVETAREPWQRQVSHPWLDTDMDYRIAPVYIILFGDTRTQVGLPMIIRFDTNLRRSIFTSSLASAFLYMHLAATTLGLATQWVSAVAMPYTHCLLKDLLGIPQAMEVYDMMAIGYPAYKSRPKLLRPREEMVHYDHCKEADFRTNEEVNDFVRRTRAWVTANHRRGAD
jgi:nitroreductase